MRVIKIVIGILFLAGISSAQDRINEDGNRKNKDEKHRHFNKLSESLELSPVQRKEVFEIMQESKNTLRKNRQADRAAAKEARESEKIAIDNRIRAVLTAEQQVAFDKLQAEQRMKAKKREATFLAIKEYKDKNILPVMQSQRLKLEEKISEEDQALIAQLKADRPNEMERGNRKGGNRKGHQARKTKEERKAVKELVERYKSDMDVLLNEISDEQKKWKQDLKELHGSDAKRKERKVQQEGMELKKDREKSNKGKKDRKGKNADMKYLKFLLSEHS